MTCDFLVLGNPTNQLLWNWLQIITCTRWLVKSHQGTNRLIKNILNVDFNRLCPIQCSLYVVRKSLSKFSNAQDKPFRETWQTLPSFCFKRYRGYSLLRTRPIYFIGRYRYIIIIFTCMVGKWKPFFLKKKRANTSSTSLSDNETDWQTEINIRNNNITNF